MVSGTDGNGPQSTGESQHSGQAGSTGYQGPAESGPEKAGSGTNPSAPACWRTMPHALLHLDNRDIADNRFMTTGFRVRKEYLSLMAGVINVDGTCRPHFVGKGNPAYRDLLFHLKQELGLGVVLNTSFNIHGEPIVCTPDDALEMFRRTRISYLFMEDFLGEKK